MYVRRLRSLWYRGADELGLTEPSLTKVQLHFLRAKGGKVIGLRQG
jgi:hypothetical protein